MAPNDFVVSVLSPLGQDVELRPHADARNRILSEMGVTMAYPSYLEKGPNYEEEMRYYHGDTLSPKDKVTMMEV